MKLLKIFLLAYIVMITGIYGAEESQSNILWHNSTTGAIKFMPVNSMIPENTLPVVDSSNTNLVPRGMGDFTGDGKPDILFHNQNSGNLRIWEMDGTTKVNNIQVLGSSNTNLKIAGVGDFDQDGDNDIATFNTNSGALRIWVMEGTVRVDNVLVLTGANTNLVPRDAGDMDSDGIPDLVLRNNNSGAVRVWTMNSDFTRKGNEYVTGSSNTNLELRGVVDINGDGNNDILNYNTNTGKLRAWLMDGYLAITDNAEIVQEADLDWSVRGGYSIASNTPPVANAGADQSVQFYQTITITGSGTDSDGMIVSYEWTKGAAVLATTASFTYIPTAVGTDTLTLTVMDDDGATASDSMNVIVTEVPNTPPVANAGADQSVIEGDTVTLDGSGSTDPDGMITAFEWKEGSTVLSTAVSFDKSDFSVGSHTITLTVSDNDGAIASDSMNVTVTEVPNTPPVANAGTDMSTQVNQAITITGSGTDSDGTIVSYEWKKGSTLLATTASFTYTPTAVGTDTLTLTIMDDDGATASDSMNVTVTEVPNTPPVANAGTDMSTQVNQAITITGSGTDSDGTIVSYEWKKGSTLLATTASFTYTPTAVGTDTLTLTIMDDDGATASDSMNVTVTEVPNTPPVANAGSDLSVIEGDTVTLDGAGSTDPDGMIMAFEWKEGSTVLSTAVSFDKSDFSVGSHTITLTVSDNDCAIASDSMTVTVAANTPPVANAGTDQNIHSGSTVTLDGSGSSDADGDDLTYSWSFVDKPEGSNASLSDTTVVNPTFITDIDGDYIIELIVNDGRLESAAEMVTITAISNSGTLDPTFDGDGIVMSSNMDDTGNTIALDSAGNIYVAGSSINTDGNYDMTIWKYKSDGAPDNTFSEDGIVMHDNAAGGHSEDRGHSIALDSDGNIYVTGYSYNANGNRDMTVWKFRSDGELDTSFSEDGIQMHANTSYDDSGNSIVVDSAGNVYVTGHNEHDEGETRNTNMMIWKYKSNGILDTTFSGNGIVMHDNAAGGHAEDRGHSIALDSDGNIYVAGDSFGIGDIQSDLDMVIWKYRSDGTLDTTFDGDGIVLYNGTAGGDNWNYIDNGFSIVLDSDGNIYVTGRIDQGDNFDMAIWKYRNDGTPDTAFDGDGVVMYDGQLHDSGRSIALDSAGNIYVTGYSSAASRSMAVWKYRNDGTPDTAFDGDGMVMSSSMDDSGKSIALDSAGNIYVTGYSSAASGGMAVWKYK